MRNPILCAAISAVTLPASASGNSLLPQFPGARNRQGPDPRKRRGSDTIQNISLNADSVLDHLDLLDQRHVTIVEEAIAESRIGFAIQGIHAIDAPGRIFYGECLARLTEQDGTQHPDSMFVPALEALGEAPVLDRHMLKLVLDELETDPSAILECNLSADNLSDGANWAHIRDQIAARSGLASRLILKVTATMPFADIALADSLLSEARDIGCRIAIDDYGCGYATYRCLWGVKADIIKIEASFAPDPCRLHDDEGALSFLVGMAARTASVVVVKDIDTVEQLEAARFAGATHAQGDHLSTPVFSFCSAKGNRLIGKMTSTAKTRI